MEQCEGYRRTGGAFTLGPVKWKQCTENAIVTLTMEQEEVRQQFPSCMKCWQEAIDNVDIVVVSAEPIPEQE